MTQLVNKWAEVILKILKKHYPDKVQLQIIYGEIAEHESLRDYDKEPWKKGGQPRYQCWIRENLSRLRKAGLVENVGRGSGYWRYRPKMDNPV